MPMPPTKATICFSPVFVIDASLYGARSVGDEFQKSYLRARSAALRFGIRVAASRPRPMCQLFFLLLTRPTARLMLLPHTGRCDNFLLVLPTYQGGSASEQRAIRIGRRAGAQSVGHNDSNATDGESHAEQADQESIPG